MDTPASQKARDYYQILGITRTATASEVRLAFRGLARRFHPDVAGNRPGAEDRFKEINEAYGVLGDPEKRERYDKLGARWNDTPNFRPFDETGPDTTTFQYTETSFSEFFEQNFGRRKPAPEPQEESAETETEANHRPELPSTPRNPARGRDLEASLFLSPAEAKSGIVRPLTLRYKVVCPRCNGTGADCEKCRGKGKMFRKSSYSVKIPAGVTDGVVLRLKGKGEKSRSDENGDLYLTLRVGGQPQRTAPPPPAPKAPSAAPSNAATQTIVLAPWEAVLGCRLRMDTSNGRVDVEIPPGAQVGQHITVAKAGPAGAEVVFEIQIEIPTKMTRSEHQLWQQIAKCTKFRPRE